MKDIIDRLDRIIDILTTVKEEKGKFPTPHKRKKEKRVIVPRRAREVHQAHGLRGLRGLITALLQLLKRLKPIYH